VDTSGKQVVARNEQLSRSREYAVRWSADAGNQWTPVESCGGSESAVPECDADGLRCSCRVEGLSAGTVYSFQVVAGGSGGWSEPSKTIAAATEHTSESRQYAENLQKQANGEGGLSGAAIAGIVIGVIAFVLIVGLAVFAFRRRRPPPPPPGSAFKTVPPPPPAY